MLYIKLATVTYFARVKYTVWCLMISYVSVKHSMSWEHYGRTHTSVKVGLVHIDCTRIMQLDVCMVANSMACLKSYKAGSHTVIELKHQ